MIHVRFEGRSFDLDDKTMGAHATLGDAELKSLVARCLEVDAGRLRDYVVDRAPNGNLIVRPEAVYG